MTRKPRTRTGFSAGVKAGVVVLAVGLMGALADSVLDHLRESERLQAAASALAPDSASHHLPTQLAVSDTTPQAHVDAF